MSWNDPAGHVFVTGEVVTAATLNTYVKDNLIDLDRRTSPQGAYVATDESTSSATFVDLATVGPAVTVVIGSTGKSLISIYCALYNTVAGSLAIMSYAWSGASTSPASDTWGIGFAPAVGGAAGGARFGATHLGSSAAGSSTFSAKYLASADTAHFVNRRLVVTPLGS